MDFLIRTMRRFAPGNRVRRRLRDLRPPADAGCLPGFERANAGGLAFPISTGDVTDVDGPLLYAYWIDGRLVYVGAASAGIRDAHDAHLRDVRCVLAGVPYQLGARRSGDYCPVPRALAAAIRERRPIELRLIRNAPATELGTLAEALRREMAPAIASC